MTTVWCLECGNELQLDNHERTPLGDVAWPNRCACGSTFWTATRPCEGADAYAFSYEISDKPRQLSLVILR